MHTAARPKPYVLLKMGQSLDGKIASRNGDSRWVTSPRSRLFVQHLRKTCGAILVGAGTVRADDPGLDVRIPAKKHPVKVVLDSRLRTPLGARLFRTPGHVILATTSQSRLATRNAFKNKASVWVLPSENGRVRLRALLGRLALRGVTRLLVEGGGEVAASFLEKKLVDEIYFFIAPKFVGGRDTVTSLEGAGVSTMKQAILLRNVTVKKIGPDFLFHGRLRTAS